MNLAEQINLSSEIRAIILSKKGIDIVGFDHVYLSAEKVQGIPPIDSCVRVMHCCMMKADATILDFFIAPWWARGLGRTLPPNRLRTWFTFEDTPQKIAKKMLKKWERA